MSQDGDRPEYGVPAGSNMPAKKRRVQRACDACRQKRINSTGNILITWLAVVSREGTTAYRNDPPDLDGLAFAQEEDRDMGSQSRVQTWNLSRLETESQTPSPFQVRFVKPLPAPRHPPATALDAPIQSTFWFSLQLIAKLRAPVASHPSSR
ncbi:hypothetical protein K438DRAFT_1777010 [Mycena galopus ATCC 62051]|nr:hypothetical protein K438DRAFT_1777010 [Mycena galopus ATCC 62051]